ncbi:hypothetical protein POM88_040435 [Heracleum sosnowskyi]|uniref:Uncharacterized protein n=1 Tax=Heracleum sosnowskyi TaxID=360622 RepID=A0AAD8HEJ8_9APIA|nr:hypothetical protein POM88_040435 [Heracleum sosnowskyi]
MHIEKNVCDNIFGTLLNITGKSKDHLNARKDLQDLGIRKVLHPVESSDGLHLEIRATIFDIELPELPQADDGNGSMSAFWLMRKRQQEKAAKEKATDHAAVASASKRVVEESDLPEIEEGGEEVPVPKRLRGKTRTDKVHTRSFDNDKRIVIGMNEFFQPIADDDKVLSELSNFLGTIAKQCVSLTYVTWRHVPENLKKTMWNYCKARYIMPEELEMYTVQARAKKNSASRKLYVDTHTAGPKSFAQVRNKMKKKAPDQSAPCDACVFVKTRKRRERRKYKTDPAVINKKIEKINEKLNVGDAVDDILSKGKSHCPTWLLGRCAKPSNASSSNNPTDTYVQELTTKIRKSLADEVEEKVKQVQTEVDVQVKKKVQQNLAVVLKKLAEANPNITVDIEDLCEMTVSSDNDDDGTHLTGGSSF